MAKILIENCAILDVVAGTVLRDGYIAIEGDFISYAGDHRPSAPADMTIDAAGRTAMPGLIDCHVHIFLPEVNFQRMRNMPLTRLAASAVAPLQNMLNRGFTTVRDTGGADRGIQGALSDGLIAGPRLFIAGAPISQTGGHGDDRNDTEEHAGWSCCSALRFNMCIADGVPEVIKATRNQLRKGADFIKIMCSGGVASQSDPLESIQYRVDEIEAICEEARRWGTYVAAHAYSAKSAIRAVAAGVRTIEHANLVDRKAAQIIADHDAFVVPTLVTYDAMARRGKDFGMSAFSLEKNKQVLERGLDAVQVCMESGVKLGFGTDLLGNLRAEQGREFVIRAQVQDPIDVIRSATVINASILQRAGQLGVLEKGAIGDVILVDGDPLKDISVLAGDGEDIPLVIKGGKVVKNSGVVVKNGFAHP